MGIICAIFGHKWYAAPDSCYCKRRFCYEERHDWDGCKCKRCGRTRDEQHDWDGCICKRCGATRDEQHESHDWDGCICKRCGKTRNEQHESHDWESFERATDYWPESEAGFRCKRCGAERDVYRFSTYSGNP